MIQDRFLAAARPKENSLGSGGYLEVVVPFPVGRAETMQEKNYNSQNAIVLWRPKGPIGLQSPAPLGLGHLPERL